MSEESKKSGHLVVTRGLPGSGKTTRAVSRTEFEGGNRPSVIFSRDGFRRMLQPTQALSGKLDQRLEDVITKLMRSSVESSLNEGLDVIVDGTHLPHRSVREWLGIAESLGAGWQVWDMTNVHPNVCVRRQEGREYPVPEDVIRRMHRRYLASANATPEEWEPLGVNDMTQVGRPYQPDTSKPLAVIVDVDGTVAKMNGRSPYDYTRVSEDLPNQAVIDYATAISMDLEAHLIFVSGRPEACREDTRAWLEQYFDWGFELFMRSDEEHEKGVKDFTVKLGIFDREIRDNYNVHSCIDDRNQVVKLWRSLGLTCLQVAPGDF